MPETENSETEKSETESSTDEPTRAEPSELVEPDRAEPISESVQEPAKVMRIGSMIKQLLDEVRESDLDEPSRDRLREIYSTSVEEIASALSPDLRDELDRLALPFSDDALPTEAELRIAQAQLVGWLEGLFHGIQAALVAQQVAARQQLEHMRGQLTPGQAPQGAPQGQPVAGGPGGSQLPSEPPPGTYL